MKRIMIMLTLLLILAACGKKDEAQIWTTMMEADLYRVSALAGGRISKIYVAEGDEVQAGDKIAELDDSDLRYTLEQMQASLQELEAQKQLYNTQIALAAVDLEYQTRRQNRSESLYEEEVIPLQNLEDGQILKNKAELQHESARKNLRLVEAKRAAIEAQIKSVQKKIQDCIITTAFTGRVEHIYFDEGEMLPNMGQLALILNIQSLEANIYVGEEYLAQFHPGMQLNLKVNGYADAIEARIIRISNKAEFTPKTVLTPDNRTVMVYAIRLKAENPEGILKDGMPVDVVLP
ncbi:MAG: efflux RND transporter periplasmic adaptor subunit [Candidatus Cloacimonadaceae bacterium]|nr:efflux RND transporter periplasmic adaptor subunit [Candidatus Cloacimonadota bacterium]MCB5255452.1 efflux RND transporter periplasmic adaptor subunit [Candidatus Cloacimonadota bacterium]MCK9178967.1 efflux RND transporter periplasmic adaptor subunit [Candidatus Cloacimonadota bacterium]MCK9242990.1 efflux RND transporter periplasmic adaptor subunit [Candidatus Cloacimonadota bacterium]MDY0126912.1 efflux RND transporter periplasmic adaptor subunit [Candidatus Cloacimonadaceae bacterium]